MPANPPARFIVGTGRCGSTLLSRMLSEHDGLLSVFEFFSGIDQFFRFQAAPVTGAELAGRLEEDHPMLTMVLGRGYEVPEVAYPFDAPSARYTRSDPIPWTLAIAVARASAEPDALFEELLGMVRAAPKQPLALHYRQLLAWLTERCGRSFWIEKSGNSMGLAPELKQCFPEARFVHLHRNGLETALSMREYSVLRLAVPVMYGELGEVDYSHDGLVAFEAAHRSDIDDILATRPPVELYGRYWSELVERGMPVLDTLGDEEVLHVAFEELVREPSPVLARIADFLAIPAGPWLDRATALVRGLPPSRFEHLSADEQHRLTDACRPGLQALERGRTRLEPG